MSPNCEVSFQLCITNVSWCNVHNFHCALWFEEWQWMVGWPVPLRVSVLLTAYSSHRKQISGLQLFVDKSYLRKFWRHSKQEGLSKVTKKGMKDSLFLVHTTYCMSVFIHMQAPSLVYLVPLIQWPLVRAYTWTVWKWKNYERIPWELMTLSYVFYQASTMKTQCHRHFKSYLFLALLC